MIHQNLIKRRADEDGLSAPAVERERVDFPLLGLTGSTSPRIEYVGPLGAKPRLLKLDLVIDELVENTATLSITRRYEDQEESRCHVYTLEEIAAEKLRCVMQRLQCRDLYDLHQLLVAGGVDAKTVWPLFERKARHRDRDPDHFGDYFTDREPRWRERWDKELAEYVTSPPRFDGVLRAVRRELRFTLVS